FQIAEIKVAGDSKLSGRTLADVNFRQAYGVTVIGLRRGVERITTISPAEKLLAGDSLIVIGLTGHIKTLEAKGSL
ncbi:MAG TPA: TrkA C-terminal domain-containing protein, partial [Kiritimatiellia bacterium]|nr:TrkA C-terminal domain-containing protein [Kiritimatiellia bacterium]